MTESIIPEISVNQETIESGFLFKIEDQERIELPYIMRFLDTSHLAEVLQLQNFVQKDLPDKRIFVPDSQDFMLKQVLGPNRGKAIGVFVHDRLIAFRTITFPGRDHHNLGKDLRLSPKSLIKVAHLESTVVHPSFRGNGLQAKMLVPTLGHIKASGHNYVLATISPFNYPSLSTVMKYNFIIRDLKSRGGVYAGKLRFLLFRDLSKPNIQEYNDILSVPNEKIYKQEDLLKHGYVGFALEKTERSFRVLYGR